jgi:large subunit ribosomal protein L24e
MKCTLCSSEIRKGTGTMYVFKTGEINYFCSTRCYKNRIILKRSLNKKEMRAKK